MAAGTALTAAVAALFAALGHPDARSEPALAGSGADDVAGVRAGDVVAMVSPRPEPVRVADLQRLAGVAAVEGCRGACFTVAGYGDQARRWAARARIALFTLSGDPPHVAPVGELAQAWFLSAVSRSAGGPELPGAAAGVAAGVAAPTLPSGPQGAPGPPPGPQDGPVPALPRPRSGASAPGATPPTLPVDEPEAVLRHRAVEGDTAAMRELADGLLSRRRLTEGMVWARRAVLAGDSAAWAACAGRLRDSGATHALWAWCEEFAGSGLPEAMLDLAGLHRAAGDAAAEARWLAACVEAGCHDPAYRLAELHEAAGRSGDALAAYRVAAEHGDVPALRQMARLLRADDPAEAAVVLRRAVDAHDLSAAPDLADLLVAAGDGSQALAVLRRAADLGHLGAAVSLGRLLFALRSQEEGELWLRVAAEAGAADADEQLTATLEAQLEAADDTADEAAAERWKAKLEALGTDRARLALGKRSRRRRQLDEAVEYLRPVAEKGDQPAVLALGEIHLELDRPHEAYDWYLRAAQADDPEAMLRVGELLFGWNVYDQAVAWLEQARVRGHPAAAQTLAERFDAVIRRAERLADGETATRFVARLKALDTVPAYRVLATRAYEQHDDDEYERWLRRAAEAGDPESMADLGKHLWHARAAADEAREWCRRAVGAGHWPALYVLDHVLPAQGPSSQERRVLWRLGAEAGWLPALEWMITRGAVTGEERRHWAGLAAAQGSAVACVALGRLALERGDAPDAATWFTRGAEADDRDAMHHLGLMRLAEGDVEQARRWFLDAATAEHKESAEQLVALLRADASPDRELVPLWQRLFAAVSDKEEASVARTLSAAYARRGEERPAARLRRLAERLT